MKTITTRHLAWGLCAVAVAAATPAFAGSFDFGGDTTLDYKATANYGLAIRTRDPDQRLLNAPVEEFQSYLYGVDRKSVVQGKSVSVRVDLVGRRLIKQKTNTFQAGKAHVGARSHTHTHSNI